ncbi:MAG TPA: hypothetical protein PLP34_03750 [Chitinophagaceae bacterium]|nr:hypothetical protein [Chitinophagaceae bacterium]
MNILSWIDRNGHWLLIALVLLVMVGIKIPDLHLPYYWDEAWSYARAIHHMQEDHITLNPAKTDPEIFRGHPLLFYAFSATLARWGSMSPLFMHTAMLILCLLLLLYFFYTLYRTFQPYVAVWAIVWLALQEVYMVQSSFLLPEIAVAMLSFFALMACYRNRVWEFLLWALPLVFIKESGLVAALSCFVFAGIRVLSSKNTSVQKIGQGILWGLPLLFFAVFLIIQKVKWGWFLFPEHTGLMNWDRAAILSKMQGILMYLTKEEYRLIPMLVFALAFFFLLVFKFRVFKETYFNSFSVLLILFILAYTVFCALNFYSTRYLLALFPPVSLLMALSFGPLFSSQRKQFVFAFCGLLYFTITYVALPAKGLGDTSKRYTASVRTQQKTIEEFVLKHAQESFHADFLMRTNLSDATCGYIPAGKQVRLAEWPDASYLICSSIEPLDALVQDALNQKQLTLVYECSEAEAWCRVYRNLKK